jgi:hypothetical protein
MSFNELIEMNRNDKKKNKDKYKVTSNYDTLGGCSITDNYKNVNNCKKYDIGTVTTHNTKEDCWIAINGNIYNLIDLKKYYKNNVKKLIRDGNGYTHITDDDTYQKLKIKVKNNEILSSDEQIFYDNMTKYYNFVNKYNYNEEISPNDKKFFIDEFKKHLKNSANEIHFNKYDKLDLICGQNYLTLDENNLFTHNLKDIKIDLGGKHEDQLNYDDLQNCMGYWSPCEYNKDKEKCERTFSDLSYLNIVKGKNCKHNRGDTKNCDKSDKCIVNHTKISAEREADKIKKKLYNILINFSIYMVLLFLYLYTNIKNTYITFIFSLFILYHLYNYLINKYYNKDDEKTYIDINYKYFKIGEVKNYNTYKRLLIFSLFCLEGVLIYWYIKTKKFILIVPIILFLLYILYILLENYIQKNKEVDKIKEIIKNNYKN